AESVRKGLKEINLTPSFSSEDALRKGHIASKSKGDITHENTQLYVYLTEEDETKLVYRVLTSSYENPGSWETIIDAQTGDIISVKDIAVYYKDKDKANPEKKKNKKNSQAKKSLVSGTGYIFNP